MTPTRIALATALAFSFPACQAFLSSDDQRPNGAHAPDAPDATAATDANAGDGDALAADAPLADAANSRYREAVLASGPIAYFPLDEPSGSATVRDVTRDAGAQVLSNVTLGAEGAVGTGASFPGNPEASIDAGTGFAFDASHPFSLEFWVKPIALPTVYGWVIRARGDQDNGYSVHFTHRNGDGGTPSLHFEHWATSGPFVDEFPVADAAPDGFAGTWVHVACVFDGVNLRILLNGVVVHQVADDQAANSEPSLAPAFLIGPSLQGVLDELAVYDRALSAEECSAHIGAR